MVEITGLNIFPVKSLQGIAVDSAPLGVRGLAFDRCWMVTDSTGRFMTQRELPAMATIGVRLAPEALVLEHPSTSALVVDRNEPGGTRVRVKVWKDECPAYDEGEAAARWLTTVLGTWRDGALRLVRFADDHRRPVDARYLRGERSHTAFTDGFPLLVTSESSLASLNAQLAASGVATVPMNRFRANIVVSGLAPFEEDALDALVTTGGAYEIAMRKPCRRCAIITTDQTDGLVPDSQEPLRTLMRMNTRADMPGAFFGQNAIVLNAHGATVSVGDQLIPTRN